MADKSGTNSGTNSGTSSGAKSKSSSYQEAVSLAPYAFFILDEEFSILELNNAAQKLLALPLEDIEKNNFASFVHQDSHEKFIALAGELSLEKSICLELMLKSGNGFSPWASMTMYRRLYEQKEQYLIWANNITEVRALSGQIKDGRAPFRKFLHDVGNALTTGSGYIELLSIQTKNESTLSGDKLDVVKKYFEKIKKSIEKTRNLIQEARWQESKSEDAKKHILIVDDEPTIAILLSELMRREEHLVQVFHDSEEALSYFSKNSQIVDLVISDQFMPKVSGIQLATEMLTLREDLPIILCTGDSQTIEKQSHGSFNIKYFISKPIDADELKNLVRSIFRNDSSQTELPWGSSN